MIVKRNFHPVKVWQYIKRPMWFAMAWAAAVWGLHAATDASELYISFTPIGVLGSALAIFIAFRNNSAYGRWWEGRQIWGSLVNHSREYARMIINFVDVCIRANPERATEMNAFKTQLIHRHIAFVHALRLHLRRQEDWEQLKPLLSPEDYERVVASNNKPNYINMLSGDHLRKGQDAHMLEWYHTFQVEGNLTQFANHLGKCERIKNTPLPRQYDYFTRVFVLLFAALLPFGILGFFQSETLLPLSWLSIPLCTVLSGVFVIMERTGAANEDPFENQVTDVPLSALCNTIERDLREMLGESDLPPKMMPENGYLY